MGNRLNAAIAEFPPGYFSLVMATGIVSIAADAAGLPLIATALFRLNIAFYIALWIANLVRVATCPALVARDLSDHVRGPGFFTAIAATCVLGSQFVIFRGPSRQADALLIAGIVLWVALFYSVFAALIVRKGKPTLAEGLSGTWLVTTVATESVSVLSSLVATHLQTQYQQLLFFLSLCMFLVGGLFYIVVITFILYVFLFTELDPARMAPAYWINMGALAITALAGSTLALGSSGSALVAYLLPFVTGIAVASWAAATCWLVLLLFLGVWRHGIRHVKLTYTFQYWSMVFPLGMYTTCTDQIAKVANLTFLAVIPRYAVFVALIAWALTSIGMIYSIANLLFRDHA